ncbi:hypothetical protein P872_22255 [Rhodonellum psychrophilum GCM71 = DSM 17998]|uniref:Uncharacterized protein n=2 Tax=Rhodonellum TaxID=336827 RepID=U5BRU6_9BACT|nr:MULTISPECIES: hypothetical protein [Rhodonellum]ERM80244.1 hypothetical protein P872_22255 [Rhodonellum psychrophilum GCM71 = DSM 17998]SDZ51590.1 hypothetical protein SAMN05444412_11943 [Rhodonellum ikkaensis]
MVNTNCYIFAFATFGHPNDFRQTPFKYGNPEIAKQVKVFDLSNAIKVFPNSTIYSIRKESIRSSKLISYSIYSFAQEQASKRDGTFIGSSIMLENAIADEQYVLNCLNEFHQKLTENNLNNGILKVNHSKDFIPISNLRDFDKIENPQIEIADLNFNTNNKSIVVYCDTSPSRLAAFFSKSIDLLNVYDTIYFTNSDEVAKFVIQKGIFKLIQNVGDKLEFEREINNLLEERKRKREQSISEFEREVQRINDDKTRTIQEFKNQIEQSERTHLENERKLTESKEDINKTGQFYDDFLNKTKNLINQLRHNNGKLEEVKQIHNSNKILFNNGISDLKRPNYTTTIPKPKPKGNLHTENQRQDFEHRSDHKRREEREEEDKVYKINIYKVATLVLAFFLIFTWVYFLFYKSNTENEKEVIQNQEQINTIPQEQKPVEITKIEDLNPKSNSILNENDFRIVAKNLKPNIKLEDVVKVIFIKNPTEISSIYSGQEAIYSKHLLELNKNCFEEKEGIYYFAKDTLRQIPSYKK